MDGSLRRAKPAPLCDRIAVMADDPDSIIGALNADPGSATASTDPDADATIKALDSDTAPKAAPPPGAPPIQHAKRPVPKMAARVPTIEAQMTGQKPPPELSLGDAITQGIHNAPTSFVNQLKGAVEPLLPSNWGSDAHNAVQLAKGAAADTGFIDQNDPAKKAKDAALLNSIGTYYAKKYGTMQGFKAALASDPASFLTDASAALTIPEGGEGLLAKLPGAVGEAASAAAKTAGAVGRNVNPVGIAARSVAAVLPKSKALTAAGGLSTGVKSAMNGAFGDRLSPADITADPAATAAMKTTVSQKGASPASMKEALLRTFEPTGSDSSIPRQTVTGKAAPLGAQGPVRDAINEYKVHVANAAQSLGGTDQSESAIGDALQGAQIDAHNEYVNNYAKVAAHDGSFDPSFAASMPEWIEGGLKKAGLTTQDLTDHPGYDQTAQALPWVQKHIQGLADNSNLTPNELMKARKSLGTYLAAAKGSDRYAMGSIVDAYDRHIQDAADNGLYNATDGNDVHAGQQVASDMGNAISSFKGYKNNFANPTGTVNGTIKQAVKQFGGQEKDGESGLITAPDTAGAGATAQGVLASKLINPKTLVTPPAAEQMYNKLASIGGPDTEQALKDHLRQTVTRTKTDPYGNLTLASTPDQIHQFLNGPLADSAFNPAEQSRLRQIAEAQRILTASPTKAAKASSLVDSLAGRGTRAVGSWALGHTLGGPLGGWAAAEAERAAEPMFSARSAASQLKGAPGTAPLFYGPGRAAKAIADKPPLSAPLSTLFQGSKDSGQPSSDPTQDAEPDESDTQALIKSAAEHHGVDPALAQKTAQQESGGNHLDKHGNVLTSPAGALGVMQLMPKTAADLGVDPTDKAQNIDGGVDYLGRMIDQFGDTAKGLAAYNAGPGAVKRALKMEAEGEGDWLSHMPDETKNYVKSILLSKNDDGRVMRAHGGKIESEDQKIERLVNRLMTLAKSAKKLENKKTEPLLKASDSLVAKALSVAQRGI